MSINVEQAISLPFSFTPTGNIQTTTSQNKIWADRVLAVVGTGQSERIQNYEFGARIYTEVFHTVDHAKSIIETEIGVAFSNFLPTLTLDSVSFVHDDANGTLEVTISYKLPNEQEVTTTIGSVTIGGNIPPKEN